jgi:hypothetical protein
MQAVLTVLPISWLVFFFSTWIGIVGRRGQALPELIIQGPWTVLSSLDSGSGSGCRQQ